MDLYGYLTETRLSSDLLVDAAGDHHVHDLALARRQGSVACPKLGNELGLLPPSAVLLDSGVNRVEQLLFT